MNIVSVDAGPYYTKFTNASDVPRSLQSWVSTIQKFVLTADVFQLFIKFYAGHRWMLRARLSELVSWSLLFLNIFKIYSSIKDQKKKTQKRTPITLLLRFFRDEWNSRIVTERLPRHRILIQKATFTNNRENLKINISYTDGPKPPRRGINTSSPYIFLVLFEKLEIRIRARKKLKLFATI